MSFGEQLQHKTLRKSLPNLLKVIKKIIDMEDGLNTNMSVVDVISLIAFITKRTWRPKCYREERLGSE